MSDNPTLRERIARLEVLVHAQTELFNRHIEHDKTKTRMLFRWLGTLVIGVILLALPGCVKLLAGVI